MVVFIGNDDDVDQREGTWLKKGNKKEWRLGHRLVGGRSFQMEVSLKELSREELGGV